MRALGHHSARSRNQDFYGWQRRATDNAFIERFFGNLKRIHSYLNPASNGLELYVAVANFIDKYNPGGIRELVGRSLLTSINKQLQTTQVEFPLAGRIGSRTISSRGRRSVYLAVLSFSLTMKKCDG
jgi:transposase InsO family protein